LLATIPLYALQAVILKVKTRLFEDHFPLAHDVGHYLNYIQIITYLLVMIWWTDKGTYSTGCIVNAIKEKSGLPKKMNRIQILTMRKPNSGNRKGFRVTIKNNKIKLYLVFFLIKKVSLFRIGNILPFANKRVTFYSLLNYNKYSTESARVKSNVFNKLN